MPTRKEVEALDRGERQNLKRLAIQIIPYLPEDQKSALYVLHFARDLVEGFLAEPAPAKPNEASERVVPLRPAH